MVEVVVEYDYEALQEDELTLRLGDVIRNVRRIDEDGWMEGDLNGKRGLFPDNFVKVKKDEPKSKEEPKEAKDVKEAKDDTPLQRRPSKNVASLVQRISTYGIPTGGLGLQPHSQPRASKKKAKKRQCKALFEYVPLNEDELELKVGDIIDITEEVEEGWWSGSMNGKSGLFPSNFVKEVDSTEDTETSDVTEEPDNTDGLSSPTSPHPGNGVMAQPKKIIGIGFGDIFKEGSVKLRVSQRGPVNEEKKEKPIPSLPSATKPTPLSSPEPPKGEKEAESKGKVKEYCKATFSYEATNQDELDLKEGDTIHVLSKDTGEPGWWRGEINGREGVFPDNFVALLPETDKETLTSKGSFKVSPKQEAEEKPKKPPPPSKTSVLKPEAPSVDKKQPQPRPEDKVVKPLPEKPAKPAGPTVPPKKPVPPSKGLLRPSIHTKRPDLPLTPSPAAKQVHNGEVPLTRTKSEAEPVPIKPKSTVVDSGEKNSETANLMSFDDVSSTSEKLTHPTAQRPKMPGRRPPAHRGQSPSKEIGEKAEKTEEVDEVDPVLSAQNSLKTSVSSPLPSTAPKAISSTHFTPEPRPKPDKEEEKGSELDDLKAQMKELMLSVELLKTQQTRELNELRKELDDERLKRVALQMEIDKVKKLVQST
ncbi:CD2-associated protein isoform X1 [Rhinichthys klamathensis goyatoka]|uniref:CD2-associated protein isoform X1 n=1 Tax=Rhinichthys klamathensis goyatoka TaxID=3034132 RepID=UPI0024B50C97|nr:CD2-associated protein isoform X1 [Rhinichthys klamathensis goyatoka]